MDLKTALKSQLQLLRATIVLQQTRTQHCSRVDPRYRATTSRKHIQLLVEALLRMIKSLKTLDFGQISHFGEFKPDVQIIVT